MNIKKRLGWWYKGLRRKFRRMSIETKRLMMVSLFVFLLGGILGGVVGKSIEEGTSEERISKVSVQIKEEKEKQEEMQNELDKLREELDVDVQSLPWNMVLVNWKHPMQEGYTPELAELERGYEVDVRILDAAKQMLADAEAAGLQIEICSAYRSVERQKQVFNESMSERVGQGMNYWEAYTETSKNVAEPGTSEHALGLALDLISRQYTELDEGQENTREAKWLAENCYKYGFILRYPPEKTSITGITYEPWHYRYVGVEQAMKIKEAGVTLEEYLEHYYTQEEVQ